MTIDAIEIAGPNAKARRLVFSDGSEPRLTAASVVKELGLEPGTSVERKTLERQLADAEPSHARDRALRMLGYRERSEHELCWALLADGFPHTVARAIVDRLVEVELVDDERFAAAWVRNRVASGLGCRRIARELAQRGVADDIVSRVLAQEEGDEIERARRALRGPRPQTPKERDRALRRLISRGFDFGTARAAIDASDCDEATPDCETAYDLYGDEPAADPSD